ncbi:hypothetical protein A9G25_12130 [Gilliamella sp. Bif1-4]|nr:hypothetical protein A9G25_12130 [Gilliamella apicola]
MDSNWQSVTDQSGIFAGSGGYDIKVGNNTDLKGAVISSEAKDKSQNRLDTGTISFSDIKNKADYQVSSSSAGVSSSGMPSMPTSRNKNESEHSTTHSAVSEGTIIIRNKDAQKQDINELSRDTEQANNELKHIFNKQKEQDIIDQTQLVSEIGGETLTMLNHIDRIRAESKAKEAVEKEKEKSKNKGLTEEEQQKIYEDAYKKAMNEGMSAMGSDTRQGIDMAVSIINGLISGDMTGAAAGALAPKIATIIKQQTEGNTVANTVSHAILGAVVAELQGNSALVGGLGAAASERGAEVIAGILYPDKDIKDLSQEERQQISALSQLATGLAIAAAGGDIQDVNTGVAAGKNAVENNYLSVSEARRKAYLTWIKPNYLGEELTEDEKRELENLEKLDKERDQILQDNCSLGNISSVACKGLLQEAWEMQNEYAIEAARTLKNSDLYPKDSKHLNDALRGLDPDNIIHLSSIEAIAKETGRDVNDVAKQYKYVMAAHGIVSSLAGLYGGVKLTSGIDTVTVYRVEGAPNTRVIIGNNGEVSIIGDTTLYLNFGDKARAQAFLDKRISQNMEGATIKSFKVSKSFLDKIRKNAVYESEVKFNKDKPVIADPTKAKDQYGIRPHQFDELKNSIIQGSGKDGNK